MSDVPVFRSVDEHVAALADLELWAPQVDSVLRRHGLDDASRAVPVAGYNPTYPTFVCGDVVVKLFGHLPGWRTTFDAERGALAMLADQPHLPAPRLLADGDVGSGSWAYVVMTRMPGSPWDRSTLSGHEQTTIAAELGTFVRDLHAAPAHRVATRTAWSPVDVTEAARRSSLPPHLAAQSAAFTTRFAAPDEPVVTHADLAAMHVFVADGHLSGVIDWGDAMVAEPHYELVQPFRDVFECDKDLLRTFLDAAGWAVGPDFPGRALAGGLMRQAYGLAQHPTMDVFQPVAERFPLDEIATLDELADALFAVEESRT